MLHNPTKGDGYAAFKQTAVEKKEWMEIKVA